MTHSPSAAFLGLPHLVNGLRKLQGLSFREVALRAGISSSSNVREWVAGLPGRLKEERIRRILPVVGLSSDTGAILPGIHRWKVPSREPEGVADLFGTLLPGRVLLARARSGDGAFRHEWLYGSMEEVRIILDLPAREDNVVASIVGALSSRVLPGPGCDGGPVPVLSSPGATLLRSGTASVRDLDSLFLPVPSRMSGDPWTYERLFERLWADGIEPEEAARRLGLIG